MAELKTKANDADVTKFLESIDNPKRREDALKLCERMQQLTGEEPVMWGAAIVGFGNQHLKYESGRELDWMKIGFSPRKASLTLYLDVDADKFAADFEKLGKYKRGKGCLYINKLEDVDAKALDQLIKKAYKAK